jgi:hypothetical protein
LLLTQDQAGGERALQKILEPTVELFNLPQLGLGNDVTPALREFLLTANACKVDPFLLSFRWRHLWRGLFPLWLEVDDGALKFIIVNSVSPNAGLLGSATGLLDEEQVSRLREMMKRAASRQVVVLMHHAICRWEQNPGDTRSMVPLQRWGLLSHDSNESQAIIEILEKEASGLVENVLLCVGHRHDIARAGPVFVGTNLGTDGWSQRLQVLESPSLPKIELQDSHISPSSYLLACRRSSNAKLVPYRTALISFAAEG